MKLEQSHDRAVDRWVFPLLRGAFAGGIAVMAMAVWAINFEAFVNAKGGGGLILALFRMIVCDAIPLAILLVTWHWLAKGTSSESLIGTILDAVFFFRNRTVALPATDDDEGFRID